MNITNQRFANLSELKSHIYAAESGWDTSYLKEYLKNIILTTDAATQEVEECGDTAVTRLDLTEETWVAATSATDADYLGETVTITYKSSAGGDAKTAIATLNGVDSTTEVEFDPVVTDGYELLTCVSSVAMKGGHTLKVGKTGLATPMATVQAAATEAVAADIYGVGSIFARAEMNNATALSVDMAFTYINYEDEVITATATTDDTNGQTEVRIVKTDGGNVNDYHRMRAWESDTAADSDTGNWIVCDRDLANVNGSGNDLYAVIAEGETEWKSTRYYCPNGYDAWLIGIWGQSSMVADAAITNAFSLQCELEPKNNNDAQTLDFLINYNLEWNYVVPIKQGTEVKLTALRTTTERTIAITVVYVEVKTS